MQVKEAGPEILVESERGPDRDGAVAVEQKRLLEQLAEQVSRLDERLAELLARTNEPPEQEFYSTSDLARLLGKAEWTVREWCRNGRVMAEKRRAGRGRYKEWMVSHVEYCRVRSEGLLPLADRQGLHRRRV